MQAIFFQVVVLVQGTRLDELEQSAGHVGVLVQHLLALCQLRQAADGTHQVTCVGLHDLVGVSCGVHICPCPPVQVCYSLHMKPTAFVTELGLARVLTLLGRVGMYSVVVVLNENCVWTRGLPEFPTIMASVILHCRKPAMVLL